MEKVARICWNTNDWKRPSGSQGKTRNKHAYENILGFGHEEWLLDDSKILPDGYHYAFLQPVNTTNRIHKGQIYNIHLITFNTVYRKKEYVGCLHQVECLSEQQAKTAYKYYKKQGWLQEMKEDIRFAGDTVKDMEADGLMFNIRFKFKDAVIYYSNRPVIAEDDPNTRAMYYTLMNKKGEFIFEKEENGEIKTLNTDPFIKYTHDGEILVDPLHKKIQNAIADILKEEYVHLYLEKDGVSGQRVDMKGLHKETDEWHYYEIKTYSARRSIRESLGQILDYAHYPNLIRAKELIIVGPEAPDDKDKTYLEFIRKTYSIPLWFRWYSFETNLLHPKI